MLHDVLVVLGIFSILGEFADVEVDALFVTALLTVIGFSVHDTIVVFDRIRENLARGTSPTFEEIVNYSLAQTIVRSINTSVTVVFTLLALYLFGGETTREFVLALLIGVSAAPTRRSSTPASCSSPGRTARSSASSAASVVAGRGTCGCAVAVDASTE